MLEIEASIGVNRRPAFNAEETAEIMADVTIDQSPIRELPDVHSVAAEYRAPQIKRRQMIVIGVAGIHLVGGKRISSAAHDPRRVGGKCKAALIAEVEDDLCRMCSDAVPKTLELGLVRQPG